MKNIINARYSEEEYLTKEDVNLLRQKGERWSSLSFGKRDIYSHPEVISSEILEESLRTKAELSTYLHRYV